MFLTQKNYIRTFLFILKKSIHPHPLFLFTPVFRSFFLYTFYTFHTFTSITNTLRFMELYQSYVLLPPLLFRTFYSNRFFRPPLVLSEILCTVFYLKSRTSNDSCQFFENEYLHCSNINTKPFQYDLGGTSYLPLSTLSRFYLWISGGFSDTIVCSIFYFPPTWYCHRYLYLC